MSGSQNPLPTTEDRFHNFASDKNKFGVHVWFELDGAKRDMYILPEMKVHPEIVKGLISWERMSRLQRRKLRAYLSKVKPPKK